MGTAWLHAGLGPDASLVTVERDARRWAATRDLYADDGRVRVIHGDWRALAGHAPFDLFFCDGGGKRDDPDAVSEMLAPGGVLVLDDFTASNAWPPHHDGRVDGLRLHYLTHPQLHAAEVGVGGNAVVLLGTRRAG